MYLRKNITEVDSFLTIFVFSYLRELSSRLFLLIEKSTEVVKNHDFIQSLHVVSWSL